MPKRKYKAITVVEVHEEDEDAAPYDGEALESDETILPLPLAATLHGSFRRVDHLCSDGAWVHGAVGV